MAIITDAALLRKPCEPVKTIDEGLAIARQLQAELAKHNKKAVKTYRKDSGKDKTLVIGLGLSAPQIGITKRVCLLIVGGKPTVLLNPTIVSRSTTTIEFEEGCLSLPGLKVKVKRSLWVEVETLNRETRFFGPRTPEEYTKDNILLSIVAQHEMDHCFGVLISDYQGGGSEYSAPSDSSV